MCNCQHFAGKKCHGAECWGDVPLADVTFNTEAISLPHQIILPLPVANRSRSARKLTLNEATMKLPIPIAEYLQNHGVYREWVAAVSAGEAA